MRETVAGATSTTEFRCGGQRGGGYGAARPGLGDRVKQRFRTTLWQDGAGVEAGFRSFDQPWRSVPGGGAGGPQGRTQLSGVGAQDTF